jgi:hypothetical protein
MRLFLGFLVAAACGPAKTSTTTTTPPPPPPPAIDAAPEPPPPVDAAPAPVVVKPAVGCIPRGAFTIIEGAVDGAPAICYQRETDKQCSVFPQGGAARAIEEDDVPAIYVQSSIVKDTGEVCVDQKCRKLGAKLKAVVAKGGAGAYFGTTDLAAVIGPDPDAGGETAYAWKVDSDLKLGFQRPAGVPADAHATPSQSHIFGPRFVVFWYSAGHGTEILVDSAGRNLGQPFQSDWIGPVGNRYLATLDGKAIRVLGVTGGSRGSVDLPLPPVAGVAQVLDDHTLATVIEDTASGSRQIAWVKVGDDGAPKLASTTDITCP